MHAWKIGSFLIFYWKFVIVSSLLDDAMFAVSQTITSFLCFSVWPLNFIIVIVIDALKQFQDFLDDFFLLFIRP